MDSPLKETRKQFESVDLFVSSHFHNDAIPSWLQKCNHKPLNVTSIQCIRKKKRRKRNISPPTCHPPENPIFYRRTVIKSLLLRSTQPTRRLPFSLSSSLIRERGPAVPESISPVSQDPFSLLLFKRPFVERELLITRNVSRNERQEDRRGLCLPRSIGTEIEMHRVYHRPSRPSASLPRLFTRRIKVRATEIAPRFPRARWKGPANILDPANRETRYVRVAGSTSGDRWNVRSEGSSKVLFRFGRAPSNVHSSPRLASPGLPSVYVASSTR